MHFENKKMGKFFFWFLWIMYALVYMTKYCFSSALAPIVASDVLSVQTYGFNAISDNFGWIAVSNLWGVLSAIATVLAIIALPIYLKFKKKNKDIM